jgi:histidinol dehydrogenase
VICTLNCNDSDEQCFQFYVSFFITLHTQAEHGEHATHAAPLITDPEALKDAVKKQVEYYFGKENLQTDTYLQSLMDANNSVPISAIMKVRK